MPVDLSVCKRGDKLMSTHGAQLEYISTTPWSGYTYLDHVVRYVKDENGKSYLNNTYGTRTNEGYVFEKNRKPEIDHDIVKIIPQ